MGLIGLLFSQYYKDYLSKGKKATILVGKCKLPKEPLFVFLSKGDSVEDSNELEKVGVAENVKTKTLTVSDLKQQHASILDYESVNSVKNALSKWQGINSEKAKITFVWFDFRSI